ncbi:Dos2-interacting transcription regulator of RNA-Pol-II-domain-containing protein [Phycomyces nitens]|nr:Dos2-interacting transcription regulator of RNA-Pol-II-domain-containing protein [Phycomyces nitens]
MTSLEREVANYMVATGDQSAEAIQAADQVVKTINATSIQDNLLKLIQTMGEYLTNEDDFVRAKGIHCNQASITAPAVSVLVDFYCERLTENTNVSNLMDGLVALTEFDKFSAANAVVVTKKLFEHVEVQRFPQVTRNTTFRVFENLLDKHVTALKTINDEFVAGFTHAVDGEKDPRNLMCAFKLIRTIIEKFDISTYVEDLFEVTFCYFPITFKPPPDDPYGITSDDLKTSLRQCIAATSHFAKFAVPLIMEKLSSTSGSAKKDSMETLEACAPVYGATSLMPHIDDIFDALKVEVFHATDQSLEEAALAAIKSVVAALATGVSNASGDPTEKALQPLIAECVTNLKDPELKNSKPSSQVLRAIGSASDPAFHYAVEPVIPMMLRFHRETDLATRKKAILDVILEYLEASRTLYGSAEDGTDAMEQDFISPLIDYKDRFFAMFESALTASNEYNGLRLAGLNGLRLMVLIKNFLSPNEIGIAIQSFNKVLMNEQDEELRAAALNALCTISKFNSDFIVEQTIPALIKQLPESSSQQVTIGYHQTLYTLRMLSPEPLIFKTALSMLVKKFDDVCEKGKFRDNTDDAYPRAILVTLLEIIKTKAESGHKDIGGYIEFFNSTLVTKAIEASLDPKRSQTILSERIMETTALILVNVFHELDATSQKTQLDRAFNVFIRGDISILKITCSTPFGPFEINSPDAQKATTHLFAAIVNTCRKEVTYPVESLEKFIDNLVNLALGTNHHGQLTSLVRMVGSLINKWKDNAALTTYVQNASSQLEGLITKRGTNSQNALCVYLWITKALIMRAHPKGYEFTDKIIGWCNDPSFNGQAPQGFDILIGGDSLALNKLSYCTMTILYNQRFFSHCLPKLVNGFRTSNTDVKHNYLIALSYLLKNVPKQILLNELPPVSV